MPIENDSYDPDGQITAWTRQADGNSPTVLNLGYDSADQLLSAILTTNTANGAVLKQYLYGYDSAGNRLSEEIQDGTNNPPAITGAGYNNLNQLTNLSGTSGQMLFSGTLDKPGTVSVNGVPAAVNPHTTNFTGYASVSPGTNVVQVVAADAYGNSRTNNYQIVVTNNGVAQTITYDLNGNEVSAVSSVSTNTYEWDGADRLTAINAGTNRSEFTYDGLGRRVQLVEKQNGTVVSTKKFVWVGMAVSEERDSSGATVTKRFFGQGQVNGTTNLFYARDHLGNVRELTDASGALRARYDYDPYGRRTKIQGDLDADFAFTGHYYHPASGLYLAPYRAYDPNTARWLSRDPIAEFGGLNLYAYVGNSAIGRVDQLGLEFGDYWDIGATMDYYSQVQATSDSGWARTGAQLANILLDFFGASDAAKAGQIYADPCSSFADKAKITAKLGIDVLGDASLAWRGLGALKAPGNLYHFTSGLRGAEINATAVLRPGAGLFGAGVYLSTSTSTTIATLQGAHATEAVVRVSTSALTEQGLRLVPTWVPGSYRIIGGAVRLP